MIQLTPIDYPFNPKKAHFMLDLETLSLEPNAAILSIGVTEVFRPDPAPFYYAVDINSQPESFFHRSNETLQWWAKQDSEVREAAFSGTRKLQFVLADLVKYIQDMKQKRGAAGIVIWANHTDFDFPIIEHAFDYHYISHPWKYKEKEDYATMLARFGEITGVQKPKVVGAHNALVDAQSQAYCLEHIVSRLMQNHGLELSL